MLCKYTKNKKNKKMDGICTWLCGYMIFSGLYYGVKRGYGCRYL